MNFYRMKMEDTLESLAMKCGIDIDDLAEANVHIGNVKNEYVGTVVALPQYRSKVADSVRRSRHITRECCHVTQLADEMKVGLEALLELNPKLKLGKVVPEGEVIISANISLPGDAITFVSDRNDNKSEIFCFYNDKRGHINLNAPAVDVNSVPKVSPDGKKICYVDSDLCLRILEINKLEDVIVAGKLLRSSNCKWDPSSERVLYENAGQIVIYDIISEETIVLGCGKNPEWIGDGCNVLYLEDGILCKCDIYTGSIDKSLNNPEVKLGLRASSDGSFLSYFTRRGNTYTLKIMDIYSGEYTVFGNFKDVWFSSGCWSGDDKNFAFWHPAQDVYGGKMSTLEVVTRGGEGFCEVPAVTQRATSKLAWSPDSKYLAFSARNSCGLGNYSVFSVGLNGDFGQITGGGNCYNPDWM